MTSMRPARWLLLALVVFLTVAQQQASAQQIPVGTTRSGTFIWDGERWIPAENDAAPQPAFVAEGEVVTASIAPPPMPVYEQPPCPAPNLIWSGSAGFPARGCLRPIPVRSGPPATGAGPAANMSSMKATGDRTSATTAA